MQETFELETIYGKYRAMVFRQCWLMVRDTELAADLTQDVFIRVQQKLHTFDQERGKFGSWLRRISTNLVVDHFRRSKTETLLTDSIDAEGFSHPIGPASLELEWLALSAAWPQLPEKDRQIIALRGQGLTYDELVLELGVTIGTVKSRLHHARNRLQELIDFGIRK